MMHLRKTVRLNGVNYEIDSEKITRLASRLEPKAIDKYWVKIQGRRFSPKQVVSELLKVPLVDFTTMDATRILGAVGFEVHSANDKPEPVRTPSDALLQEYLRSHGLTDVEVEPVIENSSSRPDYRLHADGAEVLLDVEDFASKLEDSRVRGGAPNPYGPIREKLNAARRKFKDMEGHCCCLVLRTRTSRGLTSAGRSLWVRCSVTSPSLLWPRRLDPADPLRTLAGHSGRGSDRQKSGAGKCDHQRRNRGRAIRDWRKTLPPFRTRPGTGTGT